MNEKDLEKRVTSLEQMHLWAGVIIAVGVVLYFINKKSCKCNDTKR